jgi:uncharacterized protein
MNAETAEHRRYLFAYIAPFAVFMVMTTIEGLAAVKPWYPIVYAAKLLFVIAALVGFIRYWPKLSSNGIGFGVICGIVGAFAWVYLARIEIGPYLPPFLASLVGGSRTGFDPFTLDEWSGRYRDLFIVIRMVGLAIVVPIMEELFWRGFLMRFLIAEPFHKVPIGTYIRSSFIIVTLAFVAAHPEILAALVWGAAINLLLYRTKNLWACVAMHATTNALLGAYILATASWHLW